MLQNYKQQAIEKDVPVNTLINGIITDIEMPNLDGLTLCRYIKEDPLLGMRRLYRDDRGWRHTLLPCSDNGLAQSFCPGHLAYGCIVGMHHTCHSAHRFYPDGNFRGSRTCHGRSTQRPYIAPESIDE